MIKALACTTVAILGLAVCVPSVRADEVDRKTTIRVNETILIPGGTLTPGTYVIKRMPSASNRNIVQIFNEDQNKLQATILAINNYRLEATDKTVLRYWETPSGSPPALRAWFAPGDNYGQEFAYPKKMADELSRANRNAKVPNYADNVGLGTEPESLKDVAVVSGDTGTSALASQTRGRPEPGPVPQAPPVNAGNTVAAQRDVTPAASETLLAQNQPPARPVAETSTAASQLPQTATSLAWVLFVGLVMLAAAATFRFVRRA